MKNEPRFKTEKLSPRLTRIFGFATECMYLYEGDSKAALLDSGNGFGSLRSFLKTLTDKPISVLLTHAHGDHCYGAGEFEDVYLSPLEKEAYIFHSSEALRGLNYEHLSDEGKAAGLEMLMPKPWSEIKPLNPDDEFDLGGVSVKALPLPGHTPGCMALLLPRERCLLLGDGCSYNTLLFDSQCPSISEYRNTLLKLKEKTDGLYDAVLLSHGSGRGTCDMLNAVISVCDAILSGSSDNVETGFYGMRAIVAMARDSHGRRLDGGIGNIMCRPDILEKL